MDYRKKIKSLCWQKDLFETRKLAVTHNVTDLLRHRRQGINVYWNQDSPHLPAWNESRVLQFKKFVINGEKKILTFLTKRPWTWREKSITTVTCGYEIARYIVVLAYTADGTNLYVLIIFKRKIIPKEEILQEIFICLCDKGWMDKRDVG